MAANLWRRAPSSTLPVSAAVSSSALQRALANSFWEAPSGPTAYTKSLSSSITAVGALKRLTLRSTFTGSITASASLSKSLVITKLLLASLTGSGTLKKRTARKLTGSTTGQGRIIRSARRTLRGTLTVAGLIKRLVALKRTGSVTASAALSKNANLHKAVAGSITPSGLAIALFIPALVADALPQSLTFLRRFLGRR